MSKLSVVTHGDDRLRQQCPEVKNFDKKLALFVDDMIDTMIKSRGVGIAAPQVGRLKRVVIVTLGLDHHKGEIVPLVNPVVTRESEDVVLDTEGCLSFPGQFEKIYRPREIDLTFQDLSGNTYQETFQEFDARVIHHEVDHINGVLFIDHLKS